MGKSVLMQLQILKWFFHYLILKVKLQAYKSHKNVEYPLAKLQYMKGQL